jgi:cell division protein FtsB
MFFKKSKKVNDELQQELQKLREENAKLKGTCSWLRRDLDDANDVIAEQLRNQKQILQMLKDYNAKMGYH